jgi:2-keto-4-pentenoate hydratase/2-oxohepta-3-ene-1,7-dioic acid hydratase in catechol pathway
MKLISYRDGEQTMVGAMADGGVVSLAPVFAGLGKPTDSDMIAFIGLGMAGLDAATQLLADHPAVRPASAVTILAPVPHPPKLMMGGRNYVRHVQEMQRTEAFAKVRVPKNPRIFAKYTVAVNRPGGDVHRPVLSSDIDFEGELSFVIGKPARNVTEADAMDYVYGYTIVNDVTARDLQADDELTLAKSFEGFAPMGPWLVTKDEIADPHNLRVRTYLNDRFLMENNTGEMLHRIPAFVSFLSKAFPLEVGDVITTGSPPGPGKFLVPPAVPQLNDLMRIEIEGIGWLENRLVA